MSMRTTFRASLRHMAHVIRRTPAQPAVRAGVVGAAVSVAGSYGRGLLPRSATDQAMATGVTASVHYLLTATSSAAAETVALYASGDHRVHGRKAPTTALLATDLAFIGSGLIVEKFFPPDPDEPMQVSLLRFGASFAMRGGMASALVTAVDEVLGLIPATSRWRNRSLLADAALGAGLASLAVASRHRRAQKYGLIDPDRPAVMHSSASDTAKAAAMGVAAGVGLLTVAGTEQWLARSISTKLTRRVGPVDVASPWLGHSIALALFAAGGLGAFSQVKKRIERGGDVVEAAYPEAPTSEFVSAGPNSLFGFDTIGKEGRRFVLMALTPEEIRNVMGEPGMPPIRIVAGFESTRDTRARAALCLAEMDRLGAFDRELICVASPTGVGYVSYVFTEALEYLTLGNCATVMPQYALVPSALALGDTGDGAELQRLVLRGIAERIAKLPEHRRPKVVQFGESLGAQVALDVAYPHGTRMFAEEGVSAGLYLGVPFRTLTWNAWIRDRKRFDPDGVMCAVSEPASLAQLSAEERATVSHLMVVHHDDPVNKFGYRQAVRPPWWMGHPDSRPPKVPREVLWRPITTFIITLIDLKNGMQLTPGEFARRGHDYRIDTVDSILAAYGLTCTPKQHAAIERALRAREVEWARRRLVARKFAAARDAINSTLSKWGVATSALDSLPDFDSRILDSAPSFTEELDFAVADQDPHPPASHDYPTA